MGPHCVVEPQQSMFPWTITCGGPGNPCSTVVSSLVEQPAPVAGAHPQIRGMLHDRSWQSGHCADAVDEIAAASTPAVRTSIAPVALKLNMSQTFLCID